MIGTKPGNGRYPVRSVLDRRGRVSVIHDRVALVNAAFRDALSVASAKPSASRAG